MIRVTRQSVTDDRRAHHYSLAGLRVVFQSCVPSLAAFSEAQASDRFSEMLKELGGPSAIDRELTPPLYEGEAPLAGRMRKIQNWWSDSIIELDVDGEHLCSVDLQRKHIHLMGDFDFTDSLALEVITGPAMMLQLAYINSYTLHASAVATPFGTIAFMAESGVGKSTLGRDAGATWQQLGDDMLPLRICPDDSQSGGWQFLLQDYPQLKLDDARVPHRARDQSLKAIFRLLPEATSSVRFKRLAKKDAMLQLIRHTVAARLFNDAMLREHARFSKRLSATVPVIQVSYPRNLEVLPQLRAELLRYLEDL